MPEKVFFLFILEALSSGVRTAHGCYLPGETAVSLQEEVKCSWYVEGTDCEEACDLSDNECGWDYDLAR